MPNTELFFEWARDELAAEGTEVRDQATLPKLGEPLVEILERTRSSASRTLPTRAGTG